MIGCYRKGSGLSYNQNEPQNDSLSDDPFGYDSTYATTEKLEYAYAAELGQSEDPLLVADQPAFDLIRDADFKCSSQ